jgi:hypothetical protein
MKYPHPSLAILAFAALTAGFTTASAQTAVNRATQKPIVMTPPAPPDGSNWSRAPLPALRRFDDMKAPDGKAVDDLPPNTPATNSEPPVPAARVAIFQPTPAPGITAEPGLMPTGRTVPTPPPAPPAQPQYPNK